MVTIQFKPGFDAAAYHKAKGKSRDSKSVTSQSEPNKRSPATVKSGSEHIETGSDYETPPIEEAFLRGSTGQSETPSNQQRFASQQHSRENKGGNQD